MHTSIELLSFWYDVSRLLPNFVTYFLDFSFVIRGKILSHSMGNFHIFLLIIIIIKMKWSYKTAGNDLHYIHSFFILFSFRWEFWYIDGWNFRYSKSSSSADSNSAYSNSAVKEAGDLARGLVYIMRQNFFLGCSWRQKCSWRLNYSWKQNCSWKKKILLRQKCSWRKNCSKMQKFA